MYDLKKIQMYLNKSLVVEEAYRFLRANLHFRETGNNIKTLTVASFNPGEGRTTVAINLAIYMAMMGIKVLLIDADLRKPPDHKHLGGNIHGLTTILANKIKFEPWESVTNIDNLSYIPGGPINANSPDLLMSGNFPELLRQCATIYDFILIDTPAYNSAIDSLVVATQTDAVIITAVMRITKMEELLRIKIEMEKAQVEIIGVVLNKLGDRDYKKYFEAYKYHDNIRKSRPIKVAKALDSTYIPYNAHNDNRQ